MKIKKILSLALSVICVSILSIPVSAVEPRASAQIAVYAMDVTPLSDKLSVYASVTGSGKMDKLGCESIYIYKLVNSRWVSVPDQTKLEDDTGMSSSNTYDHTNVVRCDSERGEAYKVVVTIFAENSKGRDTRSDTFYVVGK